MIFNKDKMYFFKIINYALMLFGNVLVFEVDDETMKVLKIKIGKVIDYS